MCVGVLEGAWVGVWSVFKLIASNGDRIQFDKQVNAKASEN